LPALQEAVNQSQDPEKYVHAILGLIHALDKKYPEAVAEYEASLARDPDDTLLLLRAGALRLDKTFDFETGYRHFARLLDLSPEDPSSELNLAEAALTVHRWAECRDLTTSVLQRSLDPSGALNAKWLAWMASELLGEDDQARTDWQALADAAGSLPDDFQNNWDYAGARHYLEHLAGVDPERRATLLRILEAMQNPKTAAALPLALQKPATG
jgi:tetratricopeptide (TPR) repeat protein